MWQLFDLFVPHKTFRGALAIVLSFILGFIIAITTDRLSLPLALAAVICLALSGKSKDGETQKWLFIPLRIWSPTFLLLGVASLPVEPYGPTDPRHEVLNLAEEGELPNDGLGDYEDIPYNIKEAVDEYAIGWDSENDPGDIHTYINQRGILVIVRLEDGPGSEGGLDGYEKKRHCEWILDRVEKEVRDRPSLEDEPLYIGVWEDLIYSAVQVPPGRRAFHINADSDMLYPFFGPKPDPNKPDPPADPSKATKAGP